MTKKSKHPPKKQPEPQLVSEMLTPSEIEQLRREKKELNAYEPKAFRGLEKPKPKKEDNHKM